jgi:hypothetical protein
MILTALGEAIQAAGDIRLVSAGKKPEAAGLFPATGKAGKTAVERSLDQSAPLLQVVRTEKVGKSEHRFVMVTPQGIDYWVSRQSDDTVRGLLQSSQLPASRLEAVLRSRLLLLSQRLETSEAVWKQTLDAQRQTSEELQQLVSACVLKMESLRIQLEATLVEQREQVANLERQLVALSGPGLSSPSLPPRAPAREGLTPAGENPSQGDPLHWAEMLVLSWREAETAEAREPLERAMQNLGLEPIGEPGQVVDYDSVSHAVSPESPIVARPGDRVKVQLPGWLFQDQRGGVILTPAVVLPLTQE